VPALTINAVRTEGVTFVESLLEAEEPCRVRLQPRFEGPIWSPRGADAIAARVAAESPVEIAEGTTAIGFATPVDIEGPPLAIAASEPLSDGPPTGVQGWLDRIKTRIGTAERLCAVADLSAAADAVAELGGLSAAETLAAKIERDRRLAADQGRE
jgi:hypothetical protein